MNNKLFVGNLDYTVSEPELKEAFEPFGVVVSARIVQDRETGTSRGFAFVEYASVDDARRAMDSLDESDLRGRKLAVRVAHERSHGREPRPRA